MKNSSTNNRSSNGIKGVFQNIFGRSWPYWLGGLLIGLFNVFEYIMEKPWGITTATSRWAGKILQWFGVDTQNWLYFIQKKMEAKHYFMYGSDTINIGLVLGAFIAANFAYEFAIRGARRKSMYLQALIGGILMGYGARLANGCNLGAFICSIPSLSLSGWIFWIGLTLGAFLGVKWTIRQIYRMPETVIRGEIKERKIDFSRKTQIILGIIGTIGVILLTLFYLQTTKASVVVLFLIGIAFGIIVQRSRFCWATCHKELFINKSANLLKAIIISMLVATIGFSLIMYKMVPDPSTGKLPAHAKINEIGQLFGIPGIPMLVAGIIFGLGMVLAGGCASGVLYRMGEGYISLWVAFLGTLIGYVFIAHNWTWLHLHLLAGTKVWLPQYLGWPLSVFLTLFALVLIYLWLSHWESKTRNNHIYEETKNNKIH